MALKVTAAQRRRRLVERHLLGGTAGSAAEAAEAMVALHATDPWTVYLSGQARAASTTVAEVDAALYAERALVRMLGMRRTMWVVPAALLPAVQRGCTDDVALRLRARLVKDLAAGGVGGGDPAGWLSEVEAGTLRALTARGGAAAVDLSADEPRLRTKLSYAEGKAYGATVNITSRVLMLMSAQGLIVRGDRRGGPSSGQFTWYPAGVWLGKTAPEPTVPGAGRAAAAGAAARADLARRWLAAFGPAPASDLQWWAGWTAAQTRAALAALPVTEIDLDGQDAVALTGDLDFTADAPPVAALLPALDPTPMGWRERSWYLGQHAQSLFDRTGNIGPTVWWAGQVVGGWAQRPSGEVVFRLLADIGADGAAAVAARAEALRAWLGPARVTPRFRTPLERELAA